MTGLLTLNANSNDTLLKFKADSGGYLKYLKGGIWDSTSSLSINLPSESGYLATQEWVIAHDKTNALLLNKTYSASSTAFTLAEDLFHFRFLFMQADCNGWRSSIMIPTISAYAGTQHIISIYHSNQYVCNAEVTLSTGTTGNFKQPYVTPNWQSVTFKLYIIGLMRLS